MAQHRPAASLERTARQVRPARLLDLLLHQLHAHPAGVEEARSRPTPRTSWSSASIRPSSRPRRTRRTSARRSLRYEIEHPVVDRFRPAASGSSFEARSLADRRPDRSRGQGRLAAKRRDHAANRSATCSSKAIPYYRRQGLLDEQPLALPARGGQRPGHAACAFPARCWPTKPAGGCSSPTATTTGSSSPGSTARCVDDDRLGRDRPGRRRFRRRRVQPAARHGPGRRNALRGRHREPPDPQRRSGQTQDVNTIAGTGEQNRKPAATFGRRAGRRDRPEQPLGPLGPRRATSTSPWPDRTRFGG